jgi:hypothetical protein
VHKIIKNCGICESTNLVKSIELKKFPLTGVIVERQIKNFSNYFDQKLNICKNCGHIQLSKFLSRKSLYDERYTFRTSASHLSDQSIKYFKNFLFKCYKKNFLGNVLEIGCNDIKLLKSLKNNSRSAFGIDPIWKNRKKPNKKNFTIIGDYVENINFKKTIKENINIFLNTHNLEHIENPYKLLKKVVNFSDKNAFFFVEVPDADLMIRNCRFDQVFHQHYHYFTFNSLKNLIYRLNCKIIKKSINYDFWGGSLLIAFKKNNQLKKAKLKNNFKTINTKVKKNYKHFRNHHKKLSIKLKNKNNLIGYGAGQMLPSFAYHLNSNLDFLEYILDDNKQRKGYKYQDLGPEIKPYLKNLLRKKEVLITALDGIKPISKKLRKNKIKFINPLIIRTRNKHCTDNFINFE